MRIEPRIYSSATVRKHLVGVQEKNVGSHWIDSCGSFWALYWFAGRGSFSGFGQRKICTRMADHEPKYQHNSVKDD